MPNVMKALGQTSATAASIEYLNLIRDPMFENAGGYSGGSVGVNTYIAMSADNQWVRAASNGNAGVANTGYTGTYTSSGTLQEGYISTTGAYTWVSMSYGAALGAGGSASPSSCNVNTAAVVLPNTTYYYGAAVARNTITYAHGMYMTLTWFNSAGSAISSDTTRDIQAAITTSGVFQRLNYSATSPANAAYATITFYLSSQAGASGQSIYFDGVYLSPDSSTATTFPMPSTSSSIYDVTKVAPFNKKLEKTWINTSTSLYGTPSASVTATTKPGPLVAVYTVPSGKQAVVSTLHVTNIGTTATTYRIAHVPSGETLAKKHLLAFDIPIAASSTDPWTTGIAMNSGDILYVASDSADVSFTAHGTEITP